ncbi:NAD(P)/FAD-dependent oxidoreductase [Solirubrobacter ginsenosidimutans]|uniref:NAD(P)/FAD-dependent oxidoreductase n=1 Tax=Solirubrobacter ginsenosidimutans TaxID=490573 RepID=A0A9X3MP56_9ACTN|nr:NAD(P)/FAD-dependent oxidoreductase [Solirubrobacter ginsenosidimutans]MDA0159819.1 NAD(P)/FAD-dependent oxidoreductase [Solirubrobacter ginsenosidimutans]
MPVVVVGAGHAGLAVSHVLTERSVDHVVLERGEVANTWKTERWESLRLLTPNWLTRLPGGAAYDGEDPDGFMAVPELIQFLDHYAEHVKAPVRTHTPVTSVARGSEGGYVVETDTETWAATAVVVASGAFNQARVPAVAASVPPELDQLTPLDYKRPDQLRPGRVLVVGASATGIQIADELLRAGREVTVAVGEHVRMPRTYRGRDIMWWLEQTGRHDERYDEVDDLVRARHVPSPQLIGTPDRADLDLNALTANGAALVGRLSAVNGGIAAFSGSLRNVCALADLKLNRLLDAIDEWAAAAGIDGQPGPRPEPTRVEERPQLMIDLVAAGFDTVLWATGFRADYSWLQVPVLDRKGEIRHDGGVVRDAPGLYRIGLNFLRRRKSSFIHGAEDDARDIVDHLAGYINVNGR